MLIRGSEVGASPLGQAAVIAALLGTGIEPGQVPFDGVLPLFELPRLPLPPLAEHFVTPETPRRLASGRELVPQSEKTLRDWRRFGRREAKPRRGEDRMRAGRINFRTIPAPVGNRSVPGRSIRGRPRDPSANTNVSFFGFRSCSCYPKKQFYFRESNKNVRSNSFFSWKLCS